MIQTTGIIREMRDGIIQRTRMYHHSCISATSTERECEPIRAARGRAIEKFSIDVIVRTMAGALKASTVIAECIGAAEMHAALVEGHPVGTIAILNDTLRS